MRERVMNQSSSGTLDSNREVPISISIEELLDAM